jgi:hypothetical protein
MVCSAFVLIPSSLRLFNFEELSSKSRAKSPRLINIRLFDQFSFANFSAIFWQQAILLSVATAVMLFNPEASPFIPAHTRGDHHVQARVQEVKQKEKANAGFECRSKSNGQVSHLQGGILLLLWLSYFSDVEFQTRGSNHEISTSPSVKQDSCHSHYDGRQSGSSLQLVASGDNNKKKG